MEREQAAFDIPLGGSLWSMIEGANSEPTSFAQLNQEKDEPDIKDSFNKERVNGGEIATEGIVDTAKKALGISNPANDPKSRKAMYKKMLSVVKSAVTADSWIEEAVAQIGETNNRKLEAFFNEGKGSVCLVRFNLRKYLKYSNEIDMKDPAYVSNYFDEDPKVEGMLSEIDDAVESPFAIDYPEPKSKADMFNFEIRLKCEGE